MVKKILLVVICISFLLPAAGCGNSEPVLEEEDGISIEVVNKTDGIIISFAPFFGDNLEEWGEDLLGDEVIEPGETYTFILPEGRYDFSLLTYEFYVVHSVWSITDDIRVEVGGEDKVPILVENDSEFDIAFFYISPTESDDWGEDWLGEFGYIPAEIGRRFFFIQPGDYDFLAIDIEGETVLQVQEMEIDSQKRFTIE